MAGADKRGSKKQRADELKKFFDQSDVKKQRIEKAASGDIAKMLSDMLSGKR